MPFYRTIHIEGEEYKYHIGNTGIKFSYGDTTFFKVWKDLKEEGMDIDIEENKYHKDIIYLRSDITPSIIKEYLEKTI